MNLKEYYKQILNSHLIEGNEPKRKINVRIKYRGPHLTWGGGGGDNNEQPQEPQEPLTVKGIINSLRLNAKLMRQDARGAVGDLNTDFPVVGRAIGAVKRFFTRRKRSSKKLLEASSSPKNKKTPKPKNKKTPKPAPKPKNKKTPIVDWSKYDKWKKRLSPAAAAKENKRIADVHKLFRLSRSEKEVAKRNEQGQSGSGRGGFDGGHGPSPGSRWI